MAQLFETEWEIKPNGVESGLTVYEINIKKCEYFKDLAPTNPPQQLSYGKGNGFVSGITRQKGSENAVDVVWVEGGDRNIDSQIRKNNLDKRTPTARHVPRQQTPSAEGHRRILCAADNRHRQRHGIHRHGILRIAEFDVPRAMVAVPSGQQRAALPYRRRRFRIAAHNRKLRQQRLRGKPRTHGHLPLPETARQDGGIARLQRHPRAFRDPRRGRVQQEVLGHHRHRQPRQLQRLHDRRGDRNNHF